LANEPVEVMHIMDKAEVSEFNRLLPSAFPNKFPISRALQESVAIEVNAVRYFSDDQYGNSALVMTSALRKNKIPVELHFLAEGGHGYGLRKGNIAAETWPYLLKEWLLAQF
jgi:hypothetical protein